MTAATQEVERRKVIRDCVTLGAAVGASGLSFGAVSVAAGLSTLQACALSLLVFSGGSQFALVGVLGAGGSAAAGIAGASLLGVRNTLYAVRLATLLRVPRARRVFAAQVTIDETTAMAVTAPPGSRDTAFWSRASPSSSPGTSRRSSGRSAPPCSIRTRSGSTRRSARRSLRCSRPRSMTGAARAWRSAGALLAAAAVPVTPVGVPVIVAALAILPAVVRR